MADYDLRWRNVEVKAAGLREWFHRDLRAAWGFKAAARAFHIAGSGRDVAVIGPYKGHSPTSVRVHHRNAVFAAAAAKRMVSSRAK
jgi:hypothetical protein